MRSGIGDLKFFQRKDKKNKNEQSPNGVDGAAEDLSHMRFGQGQHHLKHDSSVTAPDRPVSQKACQHTVLRNFLPTDKNSDPKEGNSHEQKTAKPKPAPAPAESEPSDYKTAQSNPTPERQREPTMEELAQRMTAAGAGTNTAKRIPKLPKGPLPKKAPEVPKV